MKNKKEYQKQYNLKNKDIIKAQRAEYARNHRKESAERVKRYRQKKRMEKDRLLLLPSINISALSTKERNRRIMLMNKNVMRQVFLRKVDRIHDKYRTRESRQRSIDNLREEMQYFDPI